MYQRRRLDLHPWLNDTWYGPYGARPGLEREDDEIRSDVIAALGGDRRIDSSSIDVQVNRGIVELRGEVEDDFERHLAADDAWSTPGVVGVMNELLARTDL
ncbi:MAG: BON domain-containing protein [Armatimonadota bacterium]